MPVLRRGATAAHGDFDETGMQAAPETFEFGATSQCPCCSGGMGDELPVMEFLVR